MFPFQLRSQLCGGLQIEVELKCFNFVFVINSVVRIGLFQRSHGKCLHHFANFFGNCQHKAPGEDCRVEARFCRLVLRIPIGIQIYSATCAASSVAQVGLFYGGDYGLRYPEIRHHVLALLRCLPTSATFLLHLGGSALEASARSLRCRRRCLKRISPISAVFETTHLHQLVFRL